MHAAASSRRHSGSALTSVTPPTNHLLRRRSGGWVGVGTVLRAGMRPRRPALEVGPERLADGGWVGVGMVLRVGMRPRRPALEVGPRVRHAAVPPGLGDGQIEIVEAGGRERADQAGHSAQDRRHAADDLVELARPRQSHHPVRVGEHAGVVEGPAGLGAAPASRRSSPS